MGSIRKYESVAQFEKRHGLKRGVVTRLCADNLLRAEKFAGVWMIEPNQNDPRKKRFEQRGLQGDIIATFDDIEECAKVADCSAKNIYRVLNKSNCKAGGFYWTKKK